MSNNIRQLALSMVAYSGASIFGPLIIFGGIGYYLYKYLEMGKVFLFLSIGVAFVVTIILQFFKVRVLLKRMNDEAAKNSGQTKKK